MSIKKWQTLINLDTNEQLKLLEAVYYLVKAQIWLKIFDFNQLTSKIGNITSESTPVVSSSKLAQSLVIKRAIQRTSGNLPWKNVCLPKSLAAISMLSRQGIPAHLVFGANTVMDGSTKMQAHSWVLVGNIFVTGKREHEKFAKLAVYNNDRMI